MRNHSLTSTQTYAEIFPDGAPIRCRYLRIPQVLAWYPFKRAKLYELLGQGEIKSFALKERGALREIRLIDRDSIDEYLERKAAEAEEQTQAVASPNKLDSKGSNSISWDVNE